MNHDYFENIDSEEKAYWLGFIYGDGNISSKQSYLSIGISNKDVHHIRTFFNDTLHSNSKEYINNDCTFFKVHSIKIKNDLSMLGVMPNKTFKLKFPTQLLPKLKRHFIRGLFDADGCVVKNSAAIEFIATEDILINIQSELDMSNYKIRPISKKSKMTCFWVSSRENKIKIYNYLYKDSTIYLSRKHDILREFIEKT